MLVIHLKQHAYSEHQIRLVFLSTNGHIQVTQKAQSVIVWHSATQLRFFFVWISHKIK